MKRWLALGVLVCAAAAAQEAPIPSSDEIGGRPFAIRDKWVIGGTGNWDYMALDPASRQLFITHQNSVQVIDIGTGLEAGEITGFAEARSVLLDPDGQFGYVTDGRGNQVIVFDRRALRIDSSIPLTCSPRSMTLVPQHPILIAICGSSTQPQPSPREPRRLYGTTSSHSESQRHPTNELPAGNSKIAIIDTERRKVLTYIVAPGDFRMAQADNNGQVFVTVGRVNNHGSQYPFPSVDFSTSHVARLDVEGMAEDAGKWSSPTAVRTRGQSAWDVDNPAQRLSYFRLDPACDNPQGLAIDNHNRRLFVACANQAMLVLDAGSGKELANLTVGPGSDAIAFDEDRGLIFTANGAGYGSLTVIREHQGDSYAVIQNLPTMERARTLALDPSSGEVFLVTDLHGVNLDHSPANGIGELKLEPVNGSFQVLVVGN